MRQEDALAKLRAEAQRLRTANFQKDANAFYMELLHDGKVFPCERDAVLASFTTAALDDFERPSAVKFTNAAGAEVQGTRLDALKEVFSRRPNHGLFGEKIQSAQWMAGVTIPRKEEPSAEDIRRAAYAEGKELAERLNAQDSRPSEKTTDAPESAPKPKGPTIHFDRRK